MILGVDGGADINRSMLVGIYKRISKEQLQPNSDHTSKLVAVDNSIAGPQKPVPTYLVCLLCSKQASLRLLVFYFVDLLSCLRFVLNARLCVHYKFFIVII